MGKKFDKRKYAKPQVHSLGSVSAAEGFCGTGGTASGTTCTNGPSTATCFLGTGASQNPGLQMCSPVGANAANCWTTGSTAGG